MAGGFTSKEAAGFLIPSKNNSHCDLPPLFPKRFGHTLTGLMACGGKDGDTRYSCSTFNFAHGNWQENYRLPIGRYYHAAWQRDDGVLLMGGQDSPLTTTLLLPGDARETRPGFNLTSPCIGCCAIEDYYTQSVILTGGTKSQHSVLRYGYDGFKEKLPNLRRPRYHHGCSMFYNDLRLPVCILIYRNIDRISFNETYMNPFIVFSKMFYLRFLLFMVDLTDITDIHIGILELIWRHLDLEKMYPG